MVDDKFLDKIIKKVFTRNRFKYAGTIFGTDGRAWIAQDFIDMYHVMMPLLTSLDDVFGRENVYVNDKGYDEYDSNEFSGKIVKPGELTITLEETNEKGRKDLTYITLCYGSVGRKIEAGTCFAVYYDRETL